MATKTGVWNLQQVRDKQLQSLWSYSGSSSEAGTLWSWGSGSDGRSGHNSTTYYSSPVQVPGDWVTAGSEGRVLSINGGIKDGGTAWLWGANDAGKLGQNNETKYSSPVQIPGTWSKLTYASNTAGGIKTDGTLWMWGQNQRGGLAQNNQTNYSSPVQIGSGTDWKYSSCSYQASLAIKTDGTLWAWGQNTDGQLGQNENSNNYSSPAQIPGTSWAYAYIGERSCWATKTDGTLWAIGYNAQGHLGQNNQTSYSSPVQIPGTTWAVGETKLTPGYYNFFATKTDGTLWAWGEGGYGTFGNESTTPASSPIQIGSDTTWEYIAAGTLATAGVKTDGTLWTWGQNAAGQLGHNSRTNVNSPVQVPGTWRGGPGGLMQGWDTLMAIKAG